MSFLRADVWNQLCSLNQALGQWLTWFVFSLCLVFKSEYPSNQMIHMILHFVNVKHGSFFLSSVSVSVKSGALNFELRVHSWKKNFWGRKLWGENTNVSSQSHMCVTHVLLYNSSASAAEEYSDLMAIYGPQSQLCNPICFWKQMWHCETVFSHATLIKYCYYLTQLFKYTWCSHV